MGDDLSITASIVGFMDSDSLIEKITAPAGEAIDAGEVVRVDTASGDLVLASAATGGAEARYPAVAVKTANTANITITAVRKGLIDLGKAWASGLTYDQNIYLSDVSGKLNTGVGAHTKIIGTTVPAGGDVGVDKLLRVDL